MRKLPTFPTVMEDLKRLSITKLKQDGFLEENTVKTGGYIWTRGGEVNLRLFFKTSLIGNPENYCLYFRHSAKPDAPVYKVRLVSVPTNLGKGKGKRWYFLCPFTGKKCLKLYFYGGYFRSRQSLDNIRYRDQNRSKPNRVYVKALNIAVCCWEKELKFLRNFRRYYNGKKTRIFKAYLKENAQLEWAAKVLDSVN